MENWKDRAKTLVWRKLHRTKITRKDPILFRNAASIHNFVDKTDFTKEEIFSLLERLLEEGSVTKDKYNKYHLTEDGVREYLS